MSNDFKIGGKAVTLVEPTFAQLKALEAKYPDRDKAVEWPIDKFNAWVFDSLLMVIKPAFFGLYKRFNTAVDIEKVITVKELRIIQESITKIIFGLDEEVKDQSGLGK
jgi:hypothetical protein